MQKNRFALLFLFVLLPFFFTSTHLLAARYDEYGNLVPDFDDEHDTWLRRQGSSLFTDRFAQAQETNPFDDRFLYEDFSQRPVRRERFDPMQARRDGFDHEDYFDGSQDDDDRAVKKFEQHLRWMEELQAGDHSSRRFQDFEARELHDGFYDSMRGQRMAVMAQDRLSMQEGLPFLTAEQQFLRIQELEAIAKYEKQLRKSREERESDRTLMRSTNPRLAQTMKDQEDIDAEIDAVIRAGSRDPEEAEGLRRRRSQLGREAAQMEIEKLGLHPRTLIQRMQDKIGEAAFTAAKDYGRNPKFLEEAQARIQRKKEKAQEEFEEELDRLMADKSSEADKFIAIFKRSSKKNGQFNNHTISTAALFTYVKAAAETIEESTIRLNALKAKPSLSKDEDTKKIALEESLESMHKLRKGLKARIDQETTNAKRRLAEVKKRAEAAKDTVFAERSKLDKYGKKITVKETHKKIVKYAQKAVEGEVKRLEELKKLTKKKTPATAKRGALFGGKLQAITDKRTFEFGKRPLLQDGREIQKIGDEMSMRSNGKPVPKRQTKYAPRPH